MVADGADLKNFFFMLRHHPDWIPRNGFGRPILGNDFLSRGCLAGEHYFPCFTSVCMGDSNAVYLAHCSHLSLLQRYGCMLPENSLAYGTTVPASKFWELLHIDDHGRGVPS